MAKPLGRPAVSLPHHEVVAYSEGASVDAIAARIGCHRKTVLNALRRMGVTMRGYGPIARRTPKPPRVVLSTEERFWSHVNRVAGGCWPWQACNLRGYGRFTVRALGRGFYAHRFAWELTHGPIPDGLHVLHRCDNPPCCNPDHLFLGTHLDNIADMIAKGRNATGDRHNSRTHPERLPRGENHKHAKLTAAQVEELRATPMKRGMQRAFARRFGVSEGTISLVVNGKVWNPPAPPVGAEVAAP